MFRTLTVFVKINLQAEKRVQGTGQISKQTNVFRTLAVFVKTNQQADKHVQDTYRVRRDKF